MRIVIDTITALAKLLEFCFQALAAIVSLLMSLTVASCLLVFLAAIFGLALLIVSF